jgi:hypothetical protein
VLLKRDNGREALPDMPKMTAREYTWPHLAEPPVGVKVFP